MADIREIFTILEDDGSGAGVKLPARIEGDASAAKNGLIGFSFKDAAGNVILPQLSAAGGIPIDEPGTCLSANGSVAGVVLVATDAATLALTLVKTYSKVDLVLSSTQTVKWDIVYIDDVGGAPSETNLLSVITGSGQFHYANKTDCLKFDTIAGTGVQNIVIRGTQLKGAPSDMHAFIGLKEA